MTTQEMPHDDARTMRAAARALSARHVSMAPKIVEMNDVKSHPRDVGRMSALYNAHDTKTFTSARLRKAISICCRRGARRPGKIFADADAIDFSFYTAVFLLSQPDAVFHDSAKQS